jgi:hypothetical protein
MSPARFKAFLTSDPFEPFTILKGDGHEVDVMSRDLVLVYPGGRTIHVVAPKFAGAKLEEDFEDHYVDVSLVTDIVKPARRKSGKKR